jgi:hypothetical protein
MSLLLLELIYPLKVYAFTLYAFTLYAFEGITSRGYRAFNAAYIQVIYMNWRFMLKIIALTRYISGAFKNDS